MAWLDRDARRLAMHASPLFSAMDVDALDAILDLATERTIGRGQVIFQRGDAGSSIMAVVRGRVRIGAVSQDGREVTLNIISPGEVFGEIALLDGKPRSADATAIEETTLLVLERRHVLPFLAANPDFALRLLAVLCDRLRRTSVAMEDMALLDLPERLARLVLKLADDFGRKAEGGIRIDIRLSQKDIGNLIASSREGTNKQLRQWQAEGVLERQGGYILLRNPATLEELLTPGAALQSN